MSYLDTLYRTILRYADVLIDPIIYVVDRTASSRNKAHFPPRGTIKCGPNKIPETPSLRTSFTDTGATIWAWPSRGGVIVLEEVTGVDFTFLRP